MRKVIITIVVIALIVGGVTIYLAATTPGSTAGVRFPLSPAQRALLMNVPASADSFALIPTAAAMEGKLRKNPVTSGSFDSWTMNQHLPRPWMIGSGDLVAWKIGGQPTSYAIKLDPLRAVLVRMYLLLGADVDARWNGTTFLINAEAEEPIAPAEITRLLSLTAALPPGDALLAQRESARGAFPPIGRPVVTSVVVGTDDVVLTSRSPVVTPSNGNIQGKFAHSALISADFTALPRPIEDLNRLFGAKLSTLLGDGGTIVLYDVSTGGLLPRPVGVVVMPATDERRAALDSFVHSIAPSSLSLATHRDAHGVDVTSREGLGYRVETAEVRGELLLSFDRNSIDAWLADTFDQPRWPASRWAMRLDPRRLVPILQKLSDNPGLRIAMPRLYRSAHDLDRWIEALSAAKSIEASDLADANGEELRVRIASK